MILVYSSVNGPRLDYICKTIFNHSVQFTNDIAVYLNYEGPKINYSVSRFAENEIYIVPHEILFQKNIQEQEIKCFQWQGYCCFFETAGTIPFDLFAASFYLIVRYEEWLPFEPDHYGRFNHENSLAFKNNFLHLPLVQFWLLEFEKLIQIRYPKFKLKEQEFRFTPTYDIDIAYCYLNQPFLKNLFGFYRDLLTAKFDAFVERANVFSGYKKDPYDQFDFLAQLNQQYHLHPIYFFLLANKRKGVDKNIHPSKKALRKLIQKTASDYKVGIHPSWQSGYDFSILNQEIQTLKNISEKQPTISRQHYLKMLIPETYPNLIRAGIKKDYTMGYAGYNGFRASYANEFFWYDLKNEFTTTLEIHPFCYMDATSIFELNLPVYEAKKDLQEIWNLVTEVKGEMVCIFHNHFLTDQPSWVEWKNMYKDFLSENCA